MRRLKNYCMQVNYYKIKKKNSILKLICYSYLLILFIIAPIIT